MAFVQDRWRDDPDILERSLESAGRLLMSGMFVSGGWDAFKAPAQRAPKAAAIGIPFPELATRANGAVMLVCGIALGAGVAVQPAAAVLAMSLVPTTIAGHAFWKEDPKARTGQRIHFLKNLAMLGGLLVLLSKRR